MNTAALVDINAGVKAAFANASGVKAMDLRVIVKPDMPKEKTQGGIILPESKKDQERYGATKGTIVSIGENAFTEAMATMKPPVVGDRVMFGKYAGTRFEGADGDDYIIMNDADILGRLEE